MDGSHNEAHYEQHFSKVKHQNVHGLRGHEKTIASHRINKLSSIEAVVCEVKRWHFLTALLMAMLVVLAGCTTLDEKQRTWIFQPSDRSWSGAVSAAEGMEDVWIDFTPSKASRL